MGIHNDQICPARSVPNSRKQQLRDVQKPRKLSWSVNNVGVLDDETVTRSIQNTELGSGWSIHRAQFTLGAETPAVALLVSAASVKNKSLVIKCTWQDKMGKTELVGVVYGGYREVVVPN